MFVICGQGIANLHRVVGGSIDGYHIPYDQYQQGTRWVRVIDTTANEIVEFRTHIKHLDCMPF